METEFSPVEQFDWKTEISCPVNCLVTIRPDYKTEGHHHADCVKECISKTHKILSKSDILKKKNVSNSQKPVVAWMNMSKGRICLSEYDALENIFVDVSVTDIIYVSKHDINSKHYIGILLPQTTDTVCHVIGPLDKLLSKTILGAINNFQLVKRTLPDLPPGNNDIKSTSFEKPMTHQIQRRKTVHNIHIHSGLAGNEVTEVQDQLDDRSSGYMTYTQEEEEEKKKKEQLWSTVSGTIAEPEEDPYVDVYGDIDEKTIDEGGLSKNLIPPEDHSRKEEKQQSTDYDYIDEYGLPENAIPPEKIYLADHRSDIEDDFGWISRYLYELPDSDPNYRQSCLVHVKRRFSMYDHLQPPEMWHNLCRRQSLVDNVDCNMISVRTPLSQSAGTQIDEKGSCNCDISRILEAIESIVAARSPQSQNVMSTQTDEVTCLSQNMDCNMMAYRALLSPSAETQTEEMGTCNCEISRLRRLLHQIVRNPSILEELDAASEEVSTQTGETGHVTCDMSDISDPDAEVDRRLLVRLSMSHDVRTEWFRIGQQLGFRNHVMNYLKDEKFRAFENDEWVYAIFRKWKEQNTSVNLTRRCLAQKLVVDCGCYEAFELFK